MWAGFGAPFGNRGGAVTRGMSSRIERAAESAARSADRCKRPLPVSAPAIETMASAAISRIATPPITAGSAWPAAARSEPVDSARRAGRGTAPPSSVAVQRRSRV